MIFWWKTKTSVHTAVTTFYIALSQVLDKQLLDHNSSLRCLQHYNKPPSITIFSSLRLKKKWRNWKDLVIFNNMSKRIWEWHPPFPWGSNFENWTMWISTCQILTRTLLPSPKLNENRQYITTTQNEWYFFLPLVNVRFL